MNSWSDWRKLESSGRIDQQVLRHLGDTAYGICYFSKPTDEDPARNEDGPSVIFEAGMLQARGDQRSELQYWIPIREKTSTPIPFDFLTHRMLFVPRLSGNKMHQEGFEVELRARLDDLLARGRPI